jgi:hypothetical protein
VQFAMVANLKRKILLYYHNYKRVSGAEAMIILELINGY